MCRNWSRDVDYNRRKPKYERGMLMEVQKIEVLGGEYYGVALRQSGSILTVIQIFRSFVKHAYLLSSNLQLLHLNANEDIKYRTAKCNTNMNLIINETSQTRKFSFNISIRWNVSEIIERNVWNHCSE